MCPLSGQAPNFPVTWCGTNSFQLEMCSCDFIFRVQFTFDILIFFIKILNKFYLFSLSRSLFYSPSLRPSFPIQFPVSHTHLFFMFRNLIKSQLANTFIFLVRIYSSINKVGGGGEDFSKEWRWGPSPTWFPGPLVARGREKTPIIANIFAHPCEKGRVPRFNLIFKKLTLSVLHLLGDNFINFTYIPKTETYRAIVYLRSCSLPLFNNKT